MKINRHRMVKSIGALVLALVLAGSLGFMTTQQALAAGSVSVKLAGADGLSEGTEFTFNMYKVGNFDGVKLELEPAYQDANVDLDIPNKDKYDPQDHAGKSWEQAWLDAANVLGEYVRTMSPRPAVVGGPYTLTPGERFTESVENGVYLVLGNTVQDSQSNAIYWTPQPVLVAVYDSDSEVTLSNDVVIKLVKTIRPADYRVVKKWSSSGKGKITKPAEINVALYCGDSVIDTIKLTPDNNWTYTWKAEEDGDTYKYIGENGKEIYFEPESSDDVWHVKEIASANEFEAATGRKPTDAELKVIKDMASRFKLEEITWGELDDGTAEITIVNKGGAVPPPRTGDDNNYMIWISILIVAAAACVILVVLRFRNRKE